MTSGRMKHEEWLAARVEQLRRILDVVIVEREEIVATDPVKAGHLADAASDLRVVIGRLEAEMVAATKHNSSGGGPGRESSPAEDENPAAHAPPPAWKALSRQRE